MDQDHGQGPYPTQPQSHTTYLQPVCRGCTLETKAMHQRYSQFGLESSKRRQDPMVDDVPHGILGYRLLSEYVVVAH